MAIAASAKPKLRGVFHELGFYAALGLGPALVVTADPGARLVAVLFAACVAYCFGASALYHRPTWKPAVRRQLARLDHIGVHLLIAGTYTAFALLVMSTAWAVPILIVVWSATVAAIALKVAWTQIPKWASAAVGLAAGWSGAAAFSQLFKLPPEGFVLVVLGGALYTAGAIVYACRRPDPAPQVFGYHELFHVLTLAAVGCQYAAIALYVLPRA